MKRPCKPSAPATCPASSAADADVIAQIKVWLLDVSPMVWRRMLVPASCSLRELHGMIQVAMGWEGIHLYVFVLRAPRFGSAHGSASSPDVTLEALHLRQGARFLYEYNRNIPWQHGIRLETWLAPRPGLAFPACIGGSGACPPEACSGPAEFMDTRDEGLMPDISRK